MPVQRLEPSSTVAPEFSGISVVGAATAHEALSDASDTSYVLLQLSETEPEKWFRGEMTNLPDGAGVVTGVIVNVRAERTDQPIDNNLRLKCGDYPNGRVTNLLTETIVDYTSAVITDLDVAECNAAQWMAGGTWVDGGAAGKQAWIYKMNFDVTFNFVSGVTVAMIFQWLGPLVAVGLHEMPRLSLELWRRSRTLLRPHELEAAWREMRDERRRRFFFPALAVLRGTTGRLTCSSRVQTR